MLLLTISFSRPLDPQTSWKLFSRIAQVEASKCSTSVSPIFTKYSALKLLVKLNDEMRPNELARPAQAETALPFSKLLDRSASDSEGMKNWLSHYASNNL